MPVQASPAFHNAGQKPGLEIWRIEAMEPVRVPDKSFGQFYTGDAYIVLITKTAARGNKYEFDLHFWIGNHCTQDESASVAIRTVELDELVLGGAAVQYRETQDHESKLFLSYFRKGGIRYLEGGTRSALKKVDPDAFEKRLFQVKGKKNVRVAQVECKCSSLNQGDTFVLDCGRTLYVWVGPKSKNKEKLGGVETAQRIRDEERGGKAVINIIESDWNTNNEFFKALGSRDKVIRAASDIDDDDIIRKLDIEILLYRITDLNAGAKTIDDVGHRPLLKSLLKSEHCYILDSGIAGIYVWMGKQCKPEFKTSVWNSVNIFLKHRGYPHWVSVTRVIDGGETSLFKQYFDGWGDTAVHLNNDHVDGVAGQDHSGADGINAKDLHKSAGKAEDWMPDDGSGKIQVWRIERGGMVLVPERSHGVFFGGDCYVILYTYQQIGKDKYIIYFWQGRKSTTEERTLSAAQAVQLDKKLGGSAVQIRVVEYKEPLHFMKIFKGRLIIFASGHVNGYQNVHDHEDYDPKRIYMFHIRSDIHGNTRANEVIGRAASLNSNDSFIVDSNRITFVWLGKHCSQEEKEMAAYMGKFMTADGSEAVVVKEGEETEKFWASIGGKEKYSTGPKQASTRLHIPPRLFHCSMTSGRFSVEEIVDFCQDDLDTTDVMLLDTQDEIFVWLGEGCQEFEKKEASRVAYNYLLSDPTGRTPDNTLIIVVRQGSEPPQFTGCFHGWDSNRWAEGKTFKELVGEVGKENSGVSHLKDEVKKYHQFYTLDVLQRKVPPEGIDVTEKEMYLSDEDFEMVFRMSKEEYDKLPAWKRNNLRREKNLF